MKLTIRSNTQPDWGDLRTRSGFLFLPKRCLLEHTALDRFPLTLSYQWRWLEYAKWEETYTISWGWYYTRRRWLKHAD